MTVHIRFLGAAGTVTGSKFLVETSRVRALVDCGLYQGRKDLRLRNWSPPPFDPSDLDAIILTHAHLDHSGYIPLITRRGFRGPILATACTEELAGIVLPDSGRLQEEEASFANRHRTSKHSPALPLYTEEDAYRSLNAFSAIATGIVHDIAPGLRLRLDPSGHILGAAIATIEVDGHTIVFSGDLGRDEHPILRPPTAPMDADAFVIESTYGDESHDDDEILATFADTINRTVARRGVIVIPAFAVDRTEILLFHLRALIRSGAIPDLPVFVDSPMALAALRVYRRAIRERSPDVRAEITEAMLHPGTLTEVHSVDHSKAIGRLDHPAIIISASGMATGGRVLHHLARRLPHARNTVILVGHQVEGTRGHRLASGEREVKMLGELVPVRAEIVSLPGFSAHADRDELVAWLSRTRSAPDRVFIVHGEPPAAAALQKAIRSQLGWPTSIARNQQTAALRLKEASR